MILSQVNDYIRKTPVTTMKNLFEVLVRGVQETMRTIQTIIVALG